MKRIQSFALVSASLAMAAGSTPALAQSAPPNPMLYLLGQEPYTANGRNFVRYRYDVLNKADYPAAMFAAAGAQLMVGVIGFAAGFASPGAAGIYEVVMGTTLFGAPFWFDLLQRAVQLRGTGAKPQAAPASVKENAAAAT